MKKAHSVEAFIEINSHFSDELTVLRQLINTTELEETVKWNMPTYCLNGKNVLSIGAFKNHFCIWFHNGVFLKDQQQLLINAQKDKTKGMRQMRFKTKADIISSAVVAYAKEATENQRMGKVIKQTRIAKAKRPIVIPDGLKNSFRLNTELKSAFNTLPPYYQREYCEYITEAKREDTKLRRLNKIIPMIISGVGLNDKYR